MGKAREYHQAMSHYVRKGISVADMTSTGVITIGTLPAGAVILNAFAVVTEAFDSATSDLLDMGTLGDPNGFMTAVSVATVGKKSADELATSNDLVLAAETDVVAVWTSDGTVATAGQMELIVEFVVDNDN